MLVTNNDMRRYQQLCKRMAPQFRVAEGPAAHVVDHAVQHEDSDWHDGILSWFVFALPHGRLGHADEAARWLS